MNRDHLLAWGFTVWALVVTLSFVWANGGQMADKFLQRLGLS